MPRPRMTNTEYQDWLNYKANKDTGSEETVTDTTHYSMDSICSAFVDGRMLTIDEYCEYYGLDRDQVKSWKLVTHTGVPYYNIAMYEKGESSLTLEAIESVISSYNQKVDVTPVQFFDRDYDFTHLNLSDVHIGMTTNMDGRSLFGGKWDHEELFERLDIIVETVLEKSGSDVLFINDLGDFLDGWDAQTARKTHKLPQNMDNEEAFDTGLEFRIKLTDKLAPYFTEIHWQLTGNSNHGGSIERILNAVTKRILETRYQHVSVTCHELFMSHYLAGDHCFILCHGKDDDVMKFGFKVHLDNKGKQAIENYIRLHNIDSSYITFKKGDTHQLLLDESSSDVFNYYNYPALSPSSKWVQGNFGIGKSGFVIENYISNESAPQITWKYFEWKKLSEIPTQKHDFISIFDG